MGIKVGEKVERRARKHEGSRRWILRQTCLEIDKHTLEDLAVEIIGSRIGPSRQRAPHAPAGQWMRRCWQICSTRSRWTRRSEVLPPTGLKTPVNAMMQTPIAAPKLPSRPTRARSHGKRSLPAPWRAAKRACNYLDPALWVRWCSYHRQSRVETKMHCLKLLGQRFMAWDFDSQVAELQVHIAVLNCYTALGIPVTTVVR